MCLSTLFEHSINNMDNYSHPDELLLQKLHDLVKPAGGPGKSRTAWHSCTREKEEEKVR